MINTENRETLLTKLFFYGLFGLLMTYTIIQIYTATGGYYYPLDDTYIHLSIAKNFLNHGVWGLNPSEFSSASSAPIYIPILALFQGTSLGEISPLLVNIVFSILCIHFIIKFFNYFNFQPITQLFTIVLIVFCGPLYIITSIGMEHTLHLLAYVLIIGFYLNVFKCKNRDLWLYMVAFLIPMIRYESVFITVLLCALSILRQRYKEAGLIFILPIVSISLFGLYMTANGSSFIPNSVLIKSGTDTSSLSAIITGMFKWVHNLFISNELSKLSFGLLFLIIYYSINEKSWNKIIQNKRLLFSFMVFAILLMHTNYASLGWYYRYEAYILFLGYIAIGFIVDMIVDTYRTSKLKAIVFSLLSLIILVSQFERGIQTFNHSHYAHLNIYSQQVTMGKIAIEMKKEGYNSVILNDIGAVQYFGQVEVLDLIGLGNNTIATFELANKKNNVFNAKDEATLQAYYREKTKVVNEEIKKFEPAYAMVYKPWVIDYLPPEYKPIASFTIPNNTICGDSVVTFFSNDKKTSKLLFETLKEQEKVLSPLITVKQL